MSFGESMSAGISDPKKLIAISNLSSLQGIAFLSVSVWEGIRTPQKSNIFYSKLFQATGSLLRIGEFYERETIYRIVCLEIKPIDISELLQKYAIRLVCLQG
jgi:hypothetical protein